MAIPIPEWDSKNRAVVVNELIEESGFPELDLSLHIQDLASTMIRS